MSNKVKLVEARKQATSTVMSLTGFVVPNREYVVREAHVNGRRVVLIYEPIQKTCMLCGEEYEGDYIGDICDACEKGMDNIGTIAENDADVSKGYEAHVKKITFLQEKQVESIKEECKDDDEKSVIKGD